MQSTIIPTASMMPSAITSSTSSASLSPNKTAQQQQTQFLQLLVAQMQGQNPLDPKDGAEFVTQLAQFSSLEELINIRTTLQSLLTAPTATAPSPFEGA